MAISDLLAKPATLGIFPGATPAMNPLQVATTHGVQRDNMLKDMEIREKIRNQELQDLTRRKEVARAKHELGNIDTQLKMEDGMKHLTFQSAQLEQVAQDINLVKDQGSYESFLSHYQTAYQGDVAPFKKEDGSLKTFEEAKGDLSNLQRTGVMNAETMRNMLKYQAEAEKGVAPSDAFKRSSELQAKGYPGWFADRVGYGMYRTVRDDQTGEMALVDVSADLANPRKLGEEEQAMIGAALGGAALPEAPTRLPGGTILTPGGKQERAIAEAQTKLSDDLQNYGNLEFLNTTRTLRQLIKDSGAIDEEGKVVGDIPGFGIGKFDISRQMRANMMNSDSALLSQEITDQFQKVINMTVHEFAGTAATAPEMKRQQKALADSFWAGDKRVWNILDKLESASEKNIQAIMSGYSSTPEAARRWQQATGQWFFKPGHQLGPQKRQTK